MTKTLKDKLAELPKERQEAIKAETQMLIDREAFEDWYKRFNNCDDKLSADFAWQAALECCRKNPEKVLEPTHYSELYKKEYEYKGNNFMDVSLAKTVTGLVYDYEVTGIRRWVELPVTYVVQYKDEDTREWQQKQFPTYEEAKQWLKENGLHEK